MDSSLGSSSAPRRHGSTQKEPQDYAQEDHHPVPQELRAEIERFAQELLAPPPKVSESSQQEEAKAKAMKPGGKESEEAPSPSRSMYTFTVTPELVNEIGSQRMQQTTLAHVAEHRTTSGRSGVRRSGRGGEAAGALEYVFAPETKVCGTADWFEDNFLSKHGMVQCCAQAWSQHLPLLLRPEHFWTMVLQGIAAHVSSHPEELRERFVAHEGKMQIRIQRDSFIKGSQRNDWGGCVREFAENVEKNVKPSAAKRIFPENNFSTAGIAEELVAKVTIMDMVKDYFEFICTTRCGFPSVSLLGTLEDWQGLRKRTEEAVRELCLREFADGWLAAMLPVLDRLVMAREGKAEGQDETFWNAMIKRGGRGDSGGFTGYTGWLHVFLPLLAEGRPNPWCVPYSPSADWVLAGRKEVGPKVLPVAEIPRGESVAPMIWDYYGMEFPMEFHAGFLGYTQDKISGAVCPVLGWYLVDTTPAVKLDPLALAADPEKARAKLREDLAKAGGAPTAAGAA